MTSIAMTTSIKQPIKTMARKPSSTSTHNGAKSMNVALHSAIEAAVTLDTFLRQPVESCNDSDDDGYCSLASELCRLGNSEEALRRELEGIERFERDTIIFCNETSASTLDSFTMEDLYAPNVFSSPHKATNTYTSDGSYMTPTSSYPSDKGKYSADLPSLMPVSPTSSQGSFQSSQGESTLSANLYDRNFFVDFKPRRTDSRLNLEYETSQEMLQELQDELDTSLGHTSGEEVTAGGKGLVDCEDFEFYHEDFSNKGITYRAASMLFGRTEYIIKYATSKFGVKRSNQGDVAMYLSTMIAVLNIMADTPHLSYGFVLFPLMWSLALSPSPYKVSEITLALVILALQGAVTITKELH